MIMDGLQKRHPECEIRIERVRKNNGYSYEGIVVRTDVNNDNICESVLPCQLYEKALEDGEMALEDILDEMEEQIKRKPVINLIQFLDYEQIKDNLCIRVINYERNKETLEDVPHQKYLDLAVVCYVLIPLPNEGMQARMLVNNALLGLWNIGESKLMRTAVYNTFHAVRVRIRKMGDVIAAIARREGIIIPEQILDTTDEYLYVADLGTNGGGAACILMKEVFKELAERNGCDLYIIPSSVYELIVILKIDDRHDDSAHIRSMVQEVNQTAVEEEDVLSDHVYLYQRETNEIVDLFKG